MARSKLNDRRARHDPAYQRAKASGYAGRAIFKLEEIDKRFRLFKKGGRVLDLGCWPGSWLQYAADRVGDEGMLVGVDLKEVEIALPSTVETFVGDVYKLKPEALVKRFGQFDVVMSDMAPHTSGVRDADQHGSEELFLRALEIGLGSLRVGGHFTAKVFQGPRFPELLRAVKDAFQEHKAFRPKNTRTGSFEQYIVGRGLKASRAATLAE